jgi:hypothetical protein
MVLPATSTSYLRTKLSLPVADAEDRQTEHLLLLAPGDRPCPGRDSPRTETGRSDALPPENSDGTPAAPETGTLVEVKRDGTMAVLAKRLNQPTSLEFIGDTAYMVNLPGEILKIEDNPNRAPRAPSPR